jgi:predicted MPP superfamily phosphohydrolase
MSHTPDLVYPLSRRGVELVLAGHNHGGQARLPGIGPVLMPSRYGRRLDQGFFRVGPTLLHVSRGVGAKHPLRFRCPPEISRIVLRAVPRRPRPRLAESVGRGQSVGDAGRAVP